ncbi:hypothetical protein Acr_11g0006460 [Actinidia rufa]|uniref:Uncharacterized protein n=1 Tax=Actinidia rufa TaxID=165716 RepID=A0A7J0FCB4_9ERIC|nr:hypothetical protein Acr_11g0006460 [Actinidia rufa]
MSNLTLDPKNAFSQLRQARAFINDEIAEHAYSMSEHRGSAGKSNFGHICFYDDNLRGREREFTENNHLGQKRRRWSFKAAARAENWVSMSVAVGVGWVNDSTKAAVDRRCYGLVCLPDWIMSLRTEQGISGLNKEFPDIMSESIV